MLGTIFSPVSDVLACVLVGEKCSDDGVFPFGCFTLGPPDNILPLALHPFYGHLLSESCHLFREM